IKIKALINSLSLRDKSVIATTIFVVALMAFGSYLILSKEKTLYLEDKKNQARVLLETVGINFANTLLYQEVGLVEEKWVLDQYITDLLKKEKNILTIMVFDNNGKVIAHSNLLDYGKSFPNSKDITEASGTVIREARDKKERPILEGITPLMIGARKIATLRIEYSQKEFYEKLAHIGKRIVFITILAISGSIILIVFGFNTMTRPLRKLAFDMDGIQYGRYVEYGDQQPKREDEIGVLQRSFSSMIKRLTGADIK